MMIMMILGNRSRLVIHCGMRCTPALITYPISDRRPRDLPRATPAVSNLAGYSRVDSVNSVSSHLVCGKLSENVLSFVLRLPVRYTQSGMT